MQKYWPGTKRSKGNHGKTPKHYPPPSRKRKKSKK
jgi:hypothetical protein